MHKSQVHSATLSPKNGNEKVIFDTKLIPPIRDSAELKKSVLRNSRKFEDGLDFVN